MKALMKNIKDRPDKQPPAAFSKSEGEVPPLWFQIFNEELEKEKEHLLKIKISTKIN